MNNGLPTQTELTHIACITMAEDMQAADGAVWWGELVKRCDLPWTYQEENLSK